MRALSEILVIVFMSEILWVNKILRNYICRPSLMNFEIWFLRFARDWEILKLGLPQFGSSSISQFPNFSIPKLEPSGCVNQHNY